MSELTKDPSTVPTIKRLDEAVVNRIAAGEVIQRPANALKELIENSLDARSTSIQVSVKDGGLKLLQIQDNGHGVKVEDMGIVCERFTTSKLRSFDDLSSMTTYGFRGEALASVSHVSHLTITSKTKDSNCAYRANYSDGAIIPAKPGAVAEPKPCAGNNGTQITAEDLFFNVPTRRRALKNPTEEYNRILDVVNRYAIHNEGVSFTCRKIGTNTPDVHTTASATVLDNIRQIYGSAVANELLSLERSFPTYSLKLKGWISNANYNVKRFAFLLFINHRAVDSPAIRKAIEAVYSVYLPKNSHPWVYLSLEMDPKTVDVNVHPTKREVHFMNEEEIINTICDAIQERLGDANLSRNFLTQTLLPQSSQLNPNDLSSSSSKKSAPKLYEYDQVRTDSRAQTLDSFLVSTTPFSASDSPTPKRQRLDIESGQDADGDEDLSLADISMITVEGDDVNDISADQDLKSGSLLSKISLYRNDPLSQGIAGSRNHGRILGSSQTQLASSRASPSVSSASGTPSETLSRGTSKPRRARIDVKLTSVLQLREEVKKEAHPVLTQIFANHTFVGILDNQRGLIQNELALYLVNYEFVSEELFYQICLRDFSNFGFIRLSKPAPIKEMVLMALDDEQDLIEQTEWPETLKSKEEIAETVEKLLVSRRDMLREYFSICVTEKGEITAIPLMIRGYVPNLENLPDFLWRLGSEVDWTSEKACFQTISRELAIFYMTQPECVKETPQETTQQSNTDQGENESNQGGNKDNDKSKDGRTGSASSHSSPQAIQDVQFQHLISSVIFPALKRGFHPPRSLIERTGVVVQVAQVKDLYKVFERC